MAYKVLDLFAGVGGLSYGFAKDDDFEIVAANEILEPMAAAYSRNHPSVKMYNKDIKDFSLDDLARDLGLRQGDVDVIVGGPPCQAYSTVGKRLIDDPRGKLFQEYFRILKELRPRLFVFENVKGLLSMQRGELIQTIVSLFESIGYHVEKKLLNAADFGTPQIRERIILVGTLGERPFAYPAPTHYDPANPPASVVGLKPYVTLGEALDDLPSILPGEKGTKYAHRAQNDYQRLMRVHAPREIQDLRSSSGFANCYCRLWWNRPSTTITRNLGCPSSSRCIHPRDPRPLSTREGARLQGFPDNYVFMGTRSDKHLQIGNAVPTFLSFAIKDAVKRYLNEE